MNSDVLIAGLGMTDFGRHPGRSNAQLGGEAAIQALREAALSLDKIEAIYCASALASSVHGETGLGQSIMMEIGLRSIPTFNVENACASGATALHLAWKDVVAGHHDAVLVVGVDKGVMPKGAVLNAGTSQLESMLGDIFPGLFGMIAQRHMAAYGTTKAQMAQVSVKNHRHGTLNPRAQFNKPVTVDEVLNAPMIADPLTLFSCCPNSDGAAAVIVCSPKLTGRRRVPRIAASIITSGEFDSMRDLTYWSSERKAVAMAYEAAALGPQDLDVLEVHDAFTIGEIIHCESIGLCEPGMGGPLVQSGATSLGGRIPVNPSGGLLAKGHPPGASGVAQIVELALQLQGRAGARQVPGARTGLAQIMGGSKGSDAQAGAVHILQAI